jgi:hypothetical protein
MKTDTDSLPRTKQHERNIGPYSQTSLGESPYFHVFAEPVQIFSGPTTLPTGLKLFRLLNDPEPAPPPRPVPPNPSI